MLHSFRPGSETGVSAGLLSLLYPAFTSRLDVHTQFSSLGPFILYLWYFQSLTIVIPQCFPRSEVFIQDQHRVNEL